MYQISEEEYKKLREAHVLCLYCNQPEDCGQNWCYGAYIQYLSAQNKNTSNYEYTELDYEWGFGHGDEEVFN